jgi:ABC-type lipoprotein release transport system permease subunit
VVIGAAGSFAVARVFRSLLFQVQPGDPVAIGAATVILGLVAVSAAAMPARRAARIHPASCLREP